MSKKVRKQSLSLPLELQKDTCAGEPVLCVNRTLLLTSYKCHLLAAILEVIGSWATVVVLSWWTMNKLIHVFEFKNITSQISPVKPKIWESSSIKRTGICHFCVQPWLLIAPELYDPYPINKRNSLNVYKEFDASFCKLGGAESTPTYSNLFQNSNGLSDIFPFVVQENKTNHSLVYSFTSPFTARF